MTAAVQVAPRAIGLVRVSKERAGMVSPELQRAAITSYAEARGYVVDRWVEGLDEPGSRARSDWWPRLDEAVAAVEDGAADVLLVWKYSRAARHRLRWAVALDRLETAGGRLESATEQLDTATSAGRFARGMLAELNAFEAERIGEGWREAHERRVRNGLPPTGKPKWGYRYDLVAKLHEPDPETGPILADLYRRYVAGESFYALVRWLNARGVPTLAGGQWSDRSLRRVLDSGFGAGLFRYRGELHPGVHESVIDADLWAAYLQARGLRRARPARVERSPYLLSGLVRCAKCGGAMVGGLYGSQRRRKYRCQTAKERGPEGCLGGYVMADYVEAAVLTWVRDHQDLLEEPVATLLARAPQVHDDHARLVAHVQAAEEALTRLAVQNARTPLPSKVYEAARGELAARLDDARTLLAAVRDEDDEEPAAPLGFSNVAELLDRWEAVAVEYRRELLRQVVERVSVTTGRPGAGVTVAERREDAAQKRK